ncbi:MAG: COG2426 family protein [Acidimicrobiia bacterium]
MRDSLTDWVRDLPLPEPLLVVLLAMTPIIELRGAIPVAQQLFDMSRWSAYWWSVLGNVIPVPLILWLFVPFVEWTERRWEGLHRLLVRLQVRTETHHARRFERLRDLALVTFVAIPLPITGAWTGSLAAVVFGVKRRRAIPLIGVGVMIAGLIVTLFLDALGLAL